MVLFGFWIPDRLLKLFGFKVSDDGGITMIETFWHVWNPIECLFFAACLGYLSQPLQQYRATVFPSKELQGLSPSLEFDLLLLVRCSFRLIEIFPWRIAHNLESFTDLPKQDQNALLKVNILIEIEILGYTIYINLNLNWLKWRCNKNWCLGECWPSGQPEGGDLLWQQEEGSWPSADLDGHWWEQPHHRRR